MTGLTPPTRLNGRVLVVGASDASGSTGIQAAIKSISALGAFASAAVTAVVTDDTATSHEVPSSPSRLSSGWCWPISAPTSW